MSEGGLPIKKISILLIALVCIGSSFSATAFINQQNNTVQEQQHQTILFSEPEIIRYDNSYTRITLEEGTSTVRIPGSPVLPKVTHTFSLPLGSIVTDITIEISELKERELDSLVVPAHAPIIDGDDVPESRPFNQKVYESNELYPSEEFFSHKTVGLDGDQHTLFYSVQYYPVRYNPAENKIYYTDEVKITVTYDALIDPIQIKNADEKDLLVIYPEYFSDEIQPLIDHKNEFGMRTYGMTLDEIYAEFTEGRDDPENIKLCIKDAIETKGITYVLLVGGIIGQSRNWHLPVRYAHSTAETFVSDYYYADIYKYEDGNVVFECWDSNENGIFAEFTMDSIDIIDGAPDVYVGRLPCRNNQEVTTIVNKIINYEKTRADDSWFKHMLLIGGDTYPYDGIFLGNEAEIYTNLSASYMDGFTFTRLWASKGTLTEQTDVEAAFNQGAGFVHMAGHANPGSLVTHPPLDPDGKIIIMQMYNFLNPFHFNPRLTNKDKLPIIVVGGCHNSQFNVSLSTIIRDIQAYGILGYFFMTPEGLRAPKFYYSEWVPRCWSWWLTVNPDGGSIATMGNTGYGMGLPGEMYLDGLNGWLFPRFFYHYGQKEEQFVGNAQGAANLNYVHEFNINADSDCEYERDISSKDRMMIQQWALIGDPSLMIGGYER